MAEGFFATLDVELVDRRRFATRAARTAIFRWIAWYNQRRLQSSHVAGRITSSSRRVVLHLDAAWPWATSLAEAFRRLRTLPQPA